MPDGRMFQPAGYRPRGPVLQPRSENSPISATASGSEVGSRYPFVIASTYEKFCPTLRAAPGVESALPDGVNAVMEIIINGRDITSIVAATQAGIAAAAETPGLIQISAGNYSGRLGKSLIYLHPDRQPPIEEGRRIRL